MLRRNEVCQDIRFESRKNDEIGLIVIRGGKPVASCEIAQEFYDIIMKEYIAEMPNIRKDEIIINGEWALSIFSDKDDE